MHANHAMRLLRFLLALTAVLALAHCGLDRGRDDPGEDEDVGSQRQALCTAGWSATWQQGSGANEWWVEYTIGGGTVASAYLEVPGRTNVVLANRYGKWAASSARITPGMQVVLHAQDTGGQSAQSVPFGYLSQTKPTTDPCTSDAGADAGGGTCGAYAPSFQQGGGANEWWVEYTIAGGMTASAYLQVVGGAKVALAPGAGKWRGSPSARIASGSSVFVHAVDASGGIAETAPFRYLVDTTAPTKPCSDGSDAGTDAGSDAGGSCSSFAPSWQQGSGANEWWIEYVPTGGAVTAVSLQSHGGTTVALTKRAEKWSASTAKIVSGTSVVLRAFNASGESAVTTPFRYLVDTAAVTRPCDVGADGGAEAGIDGGTASNDPYDPNQILTYELGFDADALAVLTSTDPATQDTWVHGTFRQGSTFLADVGFRRKGSSTFRALPKKAAFKVRFDKFVKKQKWNGYTDLTLNNSMSDPTFIVERLAYHVFRSVGMPAQRAASAHVVINGEEYGLYANIETPDDQLNDRLFGASAKTLYEINYGSAWTPGSEGGFEEEVGDGTNADVNALLSAVQAARPDALLTDVAGVLHTDEWLKFSAIEGVIGHYDGYAFGIYGSHNYFMAGDVNGRFSLFPWSTDLTMSDRATVVNAAEPQDTSVGPTLLGRCKQDPTCWAAYKDQMRGVLTAYEGLGLSQLARTWHAQVDPFVNADPKREASLSYYNSESTKLYGWIDARPALVRSQLGL